MTKLKDNEDFKILGILSISILYSIGLVLFRIFYSGTVGYIFLVWNLFLAAIPFGVSFFLSRFDRKIKSVFLVIFLIFVWLVFFPNSLYIITDLFHLRQRYNVPVWFDLILIVSFVWNGIILGFLSLDMMQDFIEKRTGKKFFGWAVVVVSLVLASFGIYIGRYLRWNSWDVLTNPMLLFNDIWDRIVNPFSHPRTFGMTLFFSLFLVIAYVTLRVIKQLNDKD